MSVIHCDVHGNIDTDFYAEHFVEGTEQCAEYARTDEEFEDQEDNY